MAFFKRNKKGAKDESPAPEENPATSPQRVGVVSGVLSTTADSEEASPFSSVVERRFGPDADDRDARATEPDDDGSADAPSMEEDLADVTPLLDEESESLNLEIDSVAHIGNATTIIGDIVAGEDLEIQGTIEGSVRLADHSITVGSEGLVKAIVEARRVHVIGKITGDVIATELVEIEAGGVIGGDVKAPRVIMSDGAIIIGGLDMSSALPASAPASELVDPLLPERPKLIKVEVADDPSSKESSF